MEISLRIMTATNRDLEDIVRSGRFRADLYYRVSVAVHTLPPLQDIKQDIPVLADHFREIFNSEFRKNVSSIQPAVLKILGDWTWPGNIRELRNVIERTTIFADATELTPRHTRASLRDAAIKLAIPQVTCP